MSLFVEQGILKISLETKYDLSTATVKKILYQKPDDTKGEWTATNVGTKLEYQVSTGDIDQVGKWKVQAYIEVSGAAAFGDPTEITFSDTIKA